VHPTFRLVVLPALLFAFVVGCGNNPRGAELSGKVTYKGAPVTGGSMTLFIGDAGYPVTIGANGEYAVSQIPEGEAVVVVETESLNPNKPKYGGKGGGGSSPAPEGKGAGPTLTYVKIPDKYKHKDKTDLKATIKRGKQQKDFDLKD